MNFGKLLRELRRTKRITQIDLAKILDVDKSTIAHYETNDIIPSVQILIKLSDYFDVSVDYLLGRKEI